MPALEIDVQALAQDMTIYKKPFDRISFERILLEDTHYKKWLYHPARQSAEAYIVRNSRQKKVYHRIYHQRHFFNVANCPLRKQVNRSSGSAYADVVQHCMHCNYCSGIRYQPAGAPPASLGSKPESLLCWAENAESMLKKFRMDIL